MTSMKEIVLDLELTMFPKIVSQSHITNVWQ
jgi:hypothetical protein